MTTHTSPVFVTGLCANCALVNACALHHSGAAIWSCDEFQPTNTQAPQVVLPTPEVTAEPSGICVDCANCTTCKLAASPGGVWACEEYR